MPTTTGRRPRNPLMEAAKEGAKRGRADRRTRGSTQDMLDRARRSQGEEAGEREVMKPKKYAAGGMTATSNRGQAMRATRMQERSDRKEAKAADRATRMQPRMGARPTAPAITTPATRPAAPAAMAPPSVTRPVANAGGAGNAGSVAPQFIKSSRGMPMAKGGKVKKMAKGGGIEKRGKTKGMMPKMAGGGKGYAKGGSIDGCATKGKTKGKMVTMAMGGKTC